MTELRVPIERLPHATDLPLPAYATPGAAGLDLLAAVPEPVMLAPMARALIPTGIRLALPPGFEAQVRPRSGLALRHGVTMVNAPGTIDADYRGEIGVILINLGSVPYRGGARRRDRAAGGGTDRSGGVDGAAGRWRRDQPRWRRVRLRPAMAWRVPGWAMDGKEV